MTESEKLDTLLQMALTMSEQERERGTDLNAGYDSRERTWELIVKYSGDVGELENMGIMVEKLLFGYAIVTIRQELIPVLASLDSVEYIEKPKLLFPQIQEGIRASCIWPVQRQTPFLNGEGIMVGIIDSGIAYENAAFLNRDGSTRIEAIYDERLGKEFTRQQIDEALRNGESLGTVDLTGHGTAVSAIAAGSEGIYQGVAYRSTLVVVRLDTSDRSGYPMTTSLLRAFDYLLKKARQMGMPMAVNLSFGNTYGAHDGSSLVERFIGSAAEYGRNVICVGSGNEAAAAGHAAGQIQRNEEKAEAAFFVGGYERALSVQLWKNYEDTFGIRLVSPGGRDLYLQEIFTRERSLMVKLDKTDIAVFGAGPKPYSGKQEIYFQFSAKDGGYIEEGIWLIELLPERIVTGRYDLYLPPANVRSRDTRFLIPSLDMTFTIPSTASRVITVGAYNTRYNAYADFSGRGYVAVNEGSGPNGVFRVKPDLTAPGVDIITTNGVETVSVSGTSFATPFVTGSAALLMQWGITLGNDPYLYGEKLKAYLIKGARPLPGLTVPSALTGWGKLCVTDAIPL
ncbi:MAG: peptidase S8 [Lachnospiraceae bacterium]|nr:peptidase S8 [Lachnospiraceae bacterium]